MASRSELAGRFFLLAALLLSVALGGAFLALKVWPMNPHLGSTRFPPAFVLSTVCLLVGSVSLARASHFVRREKQRPFRRYLVAGLITGVMFVATQTFALAHLLGQQRPDEASTGAGPFVAVIAALHAMHFVVALLFLTHVTVQAFADRYDHEYSWGVTACGWFWHGLGVVWCVILAVIGIVR